MHIDYDNAALARETRFISLISRRHDLSAEARGTIRMGEGRSIDAIRAEQAALEAEIAAFKAENRHSADSSV